MRVPRWLLSRFVVVPAVLAVAIAGWNVYVDRHDHGLVAGRVVDASGHPLPGATVVLYERAFTNEVERARTRTDAAGRFRFGENRSHVLQVQALGPDGATSPRITVRLWFRAQDRVIAHPLVVAGKA